MTKNLGLALLALIASAGSSLAQPSARDALQRCNEFIGEWKATGQPDKPRPDPRDVWQESISWSWKFKGDEAWMVFTINGGRYWKSGELRFVPDSNRYGLTITDDKDQKRKFTGTRDEKGYLTFERVEETSGEVQQLVMNTAADGVRFVYRFATKPKGRSVFVRQYQVAANRAGESLAAKSSGKKGPECIVTGGLATIAVNYKGKTYYVCCTGCKEAFDSNPEKYIREAEKK